MFRNRIAASLAICALALALAPNQAQAQVKPFKITGAGVSDALQLPGEGGPVTSPHSIVGNATQLGKHIGSGSVQPDTATICYAKDGSIKAIFGEFESGGAL